MTEKDVFLGRFVKAFGILGELKLYAADDVWMEALASQKLFVAREGAYHVTYLIMLLGEVLRVVHSVSASF